jgi:hypothetical protein
VVGLRTEFYNKSAKDPIHAKMVMPVLEGQNDMSATDDLEEVMEMLDTHVATQLMKAVAPLHATNAVKRSGDAEPLQELRKTACLHDESLPSSE